MGAIVKNGINYTGSSDSPTKTSELINDSGFITKAVNDLVNYYLKSETYSKAEVDAIVTAIKNSRFEVVATLPTEDIKTNVIYLVPSSDPKTSNVKDEYINLDGTTAGWEKIASTEIDLSGYVTTTALNTALADYTTTTDLTTLLNGKQDVFRKNSIPTATEELVGTMYQYMGATNANYTHGYWYECVVGTEPNTYKWQQTNQQPSSGGGGGGHTIEDAEGTDLTQRDTMQFGTGFKATDDSENEKTVVEADVMQSGDMDDVITPLPSVQPRYHKYSTEEQVIAEWIDGKPVYQKTITGTINNSATQTISHNITNIEKGWVIGFIIANKYSGLMDNHFVEFSVNSTTVEFKKTVAQAYENNSCIITIQYTKTTT